MSVRLIESFFGFGRVVDVQGLSWRARLAIWRQRRASRLQLAELDDKMLKDIGLSRHQALVESRRSAWDGDLAPYWSNWRRQASKAGSRTA